MSRIQIVAGLLATTIGTAWWAGALPAAWASIVRVAPYVLLVAAVMGVARSLAPPGVLIGPAVLVAAGIGWLLVRYEVVVGADLPAALPVALVVGGFFVALTGRNERWRPNAVCRYLALLWRREFRVKGTAPAKLAVVAVLAPIVIDLTAAEFPGERDAVEVDVSVFAGRVELRLPAGWKSAVGRIHSRGVQFDGHLDVATPVSAPPELARAGVDGPVVLVNVLGLAGAVALRSHPTPE